MQSSPPHLSTPPRLIVLSNWCIGKLTSLRSSAAGSSSPHLAVETRFWLCYNLYYGNERKGCRERKPQDPGAHPLSVTPDARSRPNKVKEQRE